MRPGPLPVVANTTLRVRRTNGRSRQRTTDCPARAPGANTCDTRAVVTMVVCSHWLDSAVRVTARLRPA